MNHILTRESPTTDTKFKAVRDHHHAHPYIAPPAPESLGGGNPIRIKFSPEDVLFDYKPKDEAVSSYWSQNARTIIKAILRTFAQYPKLDIPVPFDPEHISHGMAKLVIPADVPSVYDNVNKIWRQSSVWMERWFREGSVPIKSYSQLLDALSQEDECNKKSMADAYQKLQYSKTPQEYQMYLTEYQRLVTAQPIGGIHINMYQGTARQLSHSNLLRNPLLLDMIAQDIAELYLPPGTKEKIMQYQFHI